MRRQAIAVALIALGFLLFVLFAIGMGHAATTSKHKNDLGAVISDDNPNIYLLGAVAHGTVFECAKNEVCTNVIVRPYNTDLLHTESLLFCGNEVGEFKGKTDHAVVITFDRVAHRSYGGVACHDLRSVFVVNSLDIPSF